MATATKPLPPVLLLLDISVLVTSGLRDWQQFPAVGSCILPQAVADEMHALFKEAADPDLESLAKEFSRFQAQSHWQSTEIMATHPRLKAPEGHAISKKTRLSLAVARCAYGVAQRYSSRMVVLATNNQTQIQKLQALEMPNLCCITSAALRQWSQYGVRPISVMQRWQQMKAAGLDTPASKVQSGVPPSGIRSDIDPDQPSDLYSGLSAAPVGNYGMRGGSASQTMSRPQAPKSAKTTKSRSRPASKRAMSRKQELSNYPDGLSQLFSLLATVVVLSMVGWIAWSLFLKPGSMDRFKNSDPPADEQAFLGEPHSHLPSLMFDTSIDVSISDAGAVQG